MKKFIFLLICFIAVESQYGQSTVTIGAGSSMSVGNGSNVTAGYRDGTLTNSGTFNSRSITFDPVAIAATSITQTSFFANWNASAGATGYKLDVSANSNFSSFVSGYQNLDVGNTTTFSVSSSLTAGSTYYYRMRAYDIDGITGYSNVVTVVMAPPNPVATAATNINNISFSANWNSVTGATSYRLDVSTTSGFNAGTFVAGFENLNAGNVLTYSVTGLTGNTTYYYRVRACNSGTSGNSNTLTVLTAPIAPTSTAATPIAQTSFTANWDASVGATKYYLDVSTVANFASYVTGYSNLDVGDVTTYSVSTNLTAGTIYYYRLRASNGTNTGSNSNVIDLITIPPNPTSSAASNILSTSFDANWNASTGATKYYLDVSTDVNFGAGNFVADYENKDVGNVATFSVNTNLLGGTTYYYRVRAFNSGGTSGNSGAITILTKPPVPTATAATLIAQTSYSANWNAATGAAKYYLDVSTDAGFGAGNFVADYQNRDIGNVTTYSVNTNLVAGTTYYYRVRANNATGTSDNSNVISLITIPPDPASLAATNVSGTSFDLNWNTSISATGYRVDVSTDINFGAGTFVPTFENKDAGNVTTLSVSGLTENTTYYYRIRAYNGNGNSGNSGTVTALTSPVAPVAAAASNFALNSFTANWNAAVGASGYYVDVSTDNNFGAGTFIVGYEGRNVGNVTTYSVSQNLTYGTTYYYRVRAFNAGGTSNNSNTITIATLPTNPFAAAPSSVTSSSFSANWNSTTGATGYLLDVSTVSDFSSRLAAYDNLNVNNVTTYFVTGLNPNSTYYYRIRGYNDYGTGEYSSVITVLTAPGTPVTIAATLIQTTNFTANWNALAGVTGYFLDVSTASNFSSFVAGFNSIDVGNVTSYLVSGLSPGVNYYYRIRGYNSGGTGVNSNDQSVLTLSSAPSATSATLITATSFSSNWNTVTSATGYKLDVSTTSDFSSFVGVFDNLDVANVTTYSVTGLTAGNTYFYRVKAYNASGTNGNSNTITVKTTPPAPVAVAASSISNNSFNANWNASNGAAGYFLDVSTNNTFDSYVAGFSNKNIGNVTTYSVTGLAENTVYYYRVRAYNTGGTSGDSGTENLTTLVNLVGIPAVNPASLITATSFSANWNASTGATKYYLDVSTVSNFATFVATWENVDVGNVVTYSVSTNLTAGNIYYYRVRAFNAGGASGNSNTIMVRTIPPAPVENAASLITANDFNANWVASTGATGYYLDVATDNGFTSFVAGFNNRDIGNVLTYKVTGLTGNTNYYYRIRAYNTGGTSGDSGTINLTTLVGGTVIATAATSISGTSFIANWNAYGGATGYKLDVATNSTFGAGTFVAGFQNQEVNNVTTYTVSGLSNGTNYYYRVTAHDAVPADIGTSGTINVITLPDAPTSTAATSISEISFFANWNAATSATGYYIDVATNNGFTSYVTGFNNKYVNDVTTYSITGLTSGGTYYYRVKSKNGSGTGENSSTITTITIPHKPSATFATALTNNSFSANWNSSTGAAGYFLDVSTVSNFASFVGAYHDLDIGNTTDHSVAGLTGGTTYYYRIRAYNGSGTSNYSETIAALTLPIAPTSTAASSIAKTSFDANWNASVGASKYYLDIATTSGFNAGTYVNGYQNLDVGNSITFSASGLTGGTNYYYRVRAFNTSGTSDNSGTITALTLPQEPGILAATNIESVSFNANWNFSNSATGYKLSVSTASDFSSFVGAFNDFDVSNVITYNVSGLTGGSIYYYRVKAYNASGTGDNSEKMSVTTAPEAPVAIAASSLEEFSIRANWNSSVGADGYKLDVSTVSNFASFVSGFNNKDVGSVTNYLVTGLTGGTTYYYRVRAYIGGRTSSSSSSITALTRPPAVVSTAASTIASTSFSANWNTVTSATKYFLDVSVASDFSSFVPGLSAVDAGNTSTYSVTGLNANTIYYYRVGAYNASGIGASANIKTVSTAPAAPIANAATSITNASFRANWNSSVGATGYKLDVSSVANFASFVGIYNNKDVGNVTTYSIAGLSGSTTYYYRIRAVNASGSSGNSGTINLTTAVDPSGVPTSTAATSIAQTSFTANWNAVAGAAGYQLDVSTDWNFNAGTFVTDFSNRDVSNVTTYSVTGLTGGTTYYYRLRSYNASGTSSNSGIITTLTISPASVATLATSLASTSFVANWNASTSATGYLLDVSTNNLFTSFVLGYNNQDVTNVTTYSVTGLSGGTTYYFRVKAYNGSGASGNSNVITAITISSAPTATAATSLSETSFSANWNSSTGAAGYKLDISTNSGFDAGYFVTGYEDKDIGLVTTYSVSGLTGGNTYYYRVRAYNVSGTSSNSNSITAATVPVAPVAITASTIAGTSFSANWNSVTGAAKYYLDTSTDINFGAGTLIAGFNNEDVGNVNTISVSGLTVNTNYYYRVRSNNGSGTSANSNIISVLTSPAAPVASAATSQSENSFTANWASVIGATGYRLDVSTDINFGVGTFESDYENNDAGNVVTYPVTNITSETTHYYRVRAYNVGGTSSNSGTIKVLGVPFANAATAIAVTSFSANWGTVTGVTGYRLDVSSDINFGAGSFLAGFQNKDVGNVATYPVSGLTPYITYYYRVRSYDLNGSSGNSNVVIVRNTPTTPVAAAATSIGQTSFTANWAIAGGAAGYIIDVASDAGFLTFVSGFENKVVYNVTSFLVNGISPGSNYYYRIRAYNSAGTTDNSNVINLITLPDSASAVAASGIDETSFSANWNSIAGATGYKLDVSTNSDFTAGAFVTGYQDKNVNGVTSYLVSGLTGGTNYYYRVRAYNISGTGFNSNVVSALTIPAAPAAIEATLISETSFNSNWNSEESANGYRLDVSTDSLFTSFVAGYNNRDVSKVNSFIVSGLTANTFYYFRVRSYNLSGSSRNSNRVAVLTNLSAPVASAATLITETSFSANWNSVVSAVGYKLDVSTSSNFMAGTFVDGHQDKDIGGVTSYLVSGLVGGTNYYYRVRAYNVIGAGSNSSIINVITIPAAPIATAATLISETSFNSNWNAAAGAIGYYLDVSADSLFTNFVAGYNNRVVSNITTYNVSGLTENTFYYFRVRGYNVNGFSKNSNTIKRRTIPVAPVTTAATDIKQTSFTANWQAESGIDGYIIDIAYDAEFTLLPSGYQNIVVNSALSFAVTNVTPGQICYYRVRTYNSDVASNNSNVTNVVLIPADPRSTAATSISQIGFTANWDASRGADGYRLDVSTDENFISGKFAAGYLDREVLNKTSFLVNENLKKGAQYYYRVRAYNSSGTSNNSNTISLNTVPNSKPVLSGMETDVKIFTEGGSPIQVTDSLIVSDLDDTNLIGAEIQITDNYQNGEDALAFTNQNGINGLWNNTTGKMILSGNSSLVDYQTALRSVSYFNTSIKPNEITRTISFTIKDSTSLSNTITRSLKVDPVNNPPILSGIEVESLEFKIKQGKIQLTNTLTVSDVDDDSLGYAVIEISGNYIKGEDSLSCSEASGMMTTWDPAFGKMIIRGNLSSALCQNLIRSINYWNCSVRPTVLDRTVSITYNDGKDNSNTITRRIIISSVNSAPVLSGIEKSRLLYELNSLPLFVSDSLIVKDEDNLSLFGSEIKITENLKVDEDMLLFVNTANIKGTYNQAAGILSLTGQETAANYGEAIRSVMYKNIKGSQATKLLKTIEFTVWDGIINSNIEKRIIDVGDVSTGIDKESDEIPAVYALHQNYPNPFNPSTLITFDIPQASFVSIEVFDVLGRKVTALAEEQKNAGKYRIQFNGAGLSSGIYFYTIKAKDFLQTKKMILMK